MRVAVVGAGGMIGGHLVNRLVADGHDVDASDVKPMSDWWQANPEAAHNLAHLDCTRRHDAALAVSDCEWVFDLAENMGGIEFIEANRADCLESVEIGINLLRESARAGVHRFFFASSACVYRADTQLEAHPERLREGRDDWPADPEAGYGMAKLYMEELCRHYRDEGRMETRVARYHNVMGPFGSWTGGREKSPAALCRKVAEAEDGSSIEVWGDGKQARSYCYVDDCVEGTLRLMASNCAAPLNIGSDRAVTVDDLAGMVIAASGKHLDIVHVPGALGVRGRNADLSLCRQSLEWEPQVTLEDGLARLYEWVAGEVRKARLA